MPKAHDRGGWNTDEPIDVVEHQWADWERQIAVVPSLLREKGIMTVDELRRGIESLPPSEYESLSYFERWSASLELLLTEKELITRDEIDQRVTELEKRWESEGES